ncbi:MAG: hypothetical protein ACP5US_11310 [Candidatus Kryptoniota bacterium]
MSLKIKIFVVALCIFLADAVYPQRTTTVSVLPIWIGPQKIDAQNGLLFSELVADKLSSLGKDRLKIIPPSKSLSLLIAFSSNRAVLSLNEPPKVYSQSILSESLGGDLIIYGYVSDESKNTFSVRLLDPKTLEEQSYLLDVSQDRDFENRVDRLSSQLYSRIKGTFGRTNVSAAVLQFQGGMTWYPESGANVSIYLIPMSASLDIGLSQWYGLRLGVARYWSRAVAEKSVDMLNPGDALLSTFTFFGVKGGVFVNISVLRLYTDLDLSIPFFQRPDDLLPYWFLNTGIQFKLFGNFYVGGGLTFYKQRDITRINIVNGNQTYEISQLGWTYFPIFSVGVGL